jgi:hypothetical protein
MDKQKLSLEVCRPGTHPEIRWPWIQIRRLPEDGCTMLALAHEWICFTLLSSTNTNIASPSTEQNHNGLTSLPVPRR